LRLPLFQVFFRRADAFVPEMVAQVVNAHAVLARLYRAGMFPAVKIVYDDLIDGFTDEELAEIINFANNFGGEDATKNG
jgi:hypothetical protein